MFRGGLTGLSGGRGRTRRSLVVGIHSLRHRFRIHLFERQRGDAPRSLTLHTTYSTQSASPRTSLSLTRPLPTPSWTTVSRTRRTARPTAQRRNQPASLGSQSLNASRYPVPPVRDAMYDRINPRMREGDRSEGCEENNRGVVSPTKGQRCLHHPKGGDSPRSSSCLATSPTTADTSPRLRTTSVCTLMYPYPAPSSSDEDEGRRVEAKLYRV